MPGPTESSLDKLEKMASTSYNDPLACKKRADGETWRRCTEGAMWMREFSLQGTRVLYIYIYIYTYFRYTKVFGVARDTHK